MMALRRYSTTIAETASKTNVSKNIMAGIVVSRAPIVTPELSAFEKAYYKYQDELERRLMWTFPSYYYFKKGSLKERQFNAAQRGPAARQPGVWFSRGLPDIQHNRERREKQEVVIPKQKKGDDNLFSEQNESEDSLGRPIVPNSRKTEADETNNVKSLTRALDRTLYLVVKNGKTGTWKFPSFNLETRSPLHVAAEEGLRKIGGVNINTWTVSNTPAGVVRYNNSNGSVVGKDQTNESTLREFLIKSHILHGKFVSQSEDTDYMWLTKQEIAGHVDAGYYEAVAPLLSEL